MAENYMVQAKVISIGNIEQIQYTDKRTGDPKMFTKFSVECEVDGTSVNYESAGFNHGKLAVGSTYTMEIQPDDQWNHKIRGISPAGIVPPPGHLVKAAVDMGAVIVSDTPAPVSPKPAQPKTPTQWKPDFTTRWREYSTHARTAQMQATERTKMLVDLVKAGMLVNDAGEAVEKVRKSTIEEWTMQAIDLYWKEVDVRLPMDAWGDIVEDPHA